jgi:cholesterol transport system auxiliary component
MNCKFPILLGALAVSLASGCGATRPSKYYQLTVPGDLAPAADPRPYPVTLLLGPLRASHLYREDHIVYSSNGESMGTYEFQRWAQPPTEMIQEILLRQLRTSGRYREVDLLRSNARGDFLLLGRLFDFKEISGNALVARLTVEWELRDMKTASTVWTLYYTHDEPVNGKDMSAVVAALNRNVQRTVDEVKSGLVQFFSTRQLSHIP